MKWVFGLLLIANAVLGGYLYWKSVTPDPDSQILDLQMNADQVRVIPEPPRPQPAPRAAACLEWRSFSAADGTRARQALSVLAAGERLFEREVSVVASWWVHMPPQGSQAAMERKTRELADLGVTDFFAVTEAGSWRYAISLGLFRTEEAARAHLAELRARGVRTAVIGNREQRVSQTAFVLREPTAEESAKLAQLSTAWPGTELRAADCPG
jgi:hypothetical protein